MSTPTTKDDIKEGAEVFPLEKIHFNNKVQGKTKGRVIKVVGDMATVEFEIPNTPDTCHICGPFLSVRGQTDELEYLRIGCGHPQGTYINCRDLSVHQLILWKTYLEQKEEVEWQKRFAELHGEYNKALKELWDHIAVRNHKGTPL